MKYLTIHSKDKVEPGKTTKIKTRKICKSQPSTTILIISDKPDYIIKKTKDRKEKMVCHDIT